MESEGMSRKNQLENIYMSIAFEISKMSRCNRAKVGALLVKNNNIISYGFNGTPSGFCNECEENNITKKEVIHAEVNAILKAGKQSIGSDLFLTLSPCIDCCKIIKQAGINKVYIKEFYSDTSGLNKLQINYEQL
jgi:dCMP deaminase